MRSPSLYPVEPCHPLTNCHCSLVRKLSGKGLESMAAAAKIRKILGERRLLKNIPAVSVQLKREQKYHGKVKAVIDNVVEAGVKLL